MFTSDYEKTVNTPLVALIHESFGVTAKQQLADRAYVKNLTLKSENIYASLRYSYDPDGLKFVFHLLEPSFSQYAGKPLKSKKFISNSLANVMSLATKLHKGSKYVASILHEDTYNFTDFDKQFLRVLYGKHIHSGIQVLKAKRLMYEELIDCFNAKPTNTNKR